MVKHRAGRFVTRAIPLGALAVAALVSTPAWAQAGDGLPDTPPGRRLAELIAVLNPGDYSSIRSYAESTLSAEFVAGALDDRVDALMRIHAASDRLTVVRVLSASGERVIAEVVNQLAEMSQALGVSVERRAPHRITMWFQAPAGGPRTPGLPAPPPANEVVEVMGSFLIRLAAAGVFSGTMLIARGDSILVLRAFGLAHRSPDVDNRTDTRFDIGSIGKLFTTVAIAQLAEQGLLALQDPVARHLGPDWMSPELASEIRVEHLLTHRSGLGDYLESDAMLRATAPARALDDYRPVILAERPQFRPGSRFSYSNSGFLVLGAIVEHASGRSFDEYIRDRVFAPAGVVGSGEALNNPTAPPAPAYATGYTSRFSASGTSWRDNTARMANVAPSPAGGQFASAEDLWRFSRALMTGALVGDSMWRMLSSPAPVRGGPPSGYGFEVESLGDERVVGHGGSHEGIGAALDMYLRSGYTLVVLSNSDRSAFSVRAKFRSVLLRR